jgi:hypothetical protein
MTHGKMLGVSLAVLTSFSLLVGCSAGEASTEEILVPVVENIVEEFQGTPVEEVLPDSDEPFVDVTFPRSHFGSKADEQIRDEGEEAGHIGTRINSDDTVTSRLPVAIQQEFLQEVKQEIDEGIEDVYSEKPRVFKDISYDEGMAEFYFEVDRAAFEADADARWVGDWFVLWATYYQIYSGASPGERGVVANFIDVANGDVFDSEKLREWWW